MLGRTRFIALVGTSGSGKSSLVRAGLLPALYGDMLEGAGSHWRIAVFRPGEDPIRSLAEVLFPALQGEPSRGDGDFNRAIFETTLRRSSRGLVEAVAQARRGENVLIVVDQFEELFRFHNQAADSARKDEAAAFVKILLEAVADPDYPVYVLITMRSDFIGNCARFRDLPEAVNHEVIRILAFEWTQSRIRILRALNHELIRSSSDILTRNGSSAREENDSKPQQSRLSSS